MNDCLDFSACLHYELTNYKIGLLKPRSAGKGCFQLYTIKLKHKLTEYRILILLSKNQNLNEYPKFQTNQIFVAALTYIANDFTDFEENL